MPSRQGMRVGSRAEVGAPWSFQYLSWYQRHRAVSSSRSSRSAGLSCTAYSEHHALPRKSSIRHGRPLAFDSRHHGCDVIAAPDGFEAERLRPLHEANDIRTTGGCPGMGDSEAETHACPPFQRALCSRARRYSSTARTVVRGGLSRCSWKAGITSWVNRRKDARI